jgi:hypothetical protein
MEHAQAAPGRWNALLAGVFRLEVPLLARAPLPLGTSAFYVGRRPLATTAPAEGGEKAVLDPTVVSART